MRTKQTLEQRIRRRAALKRSNVLLHEDFKDLGGYNQVGRVLKKLLEEKKLFKIGFGIYAKANPKPNPINGKIYPVKSLPKIAREALERLGAKVVPTRLEQAYIEGRTNQVMTGRCIGVPKRIRRKIGINGLYVTFERQSASSKYSECD